MFRPAGRVLLRHSPLRPSFARPAFTNAARFVSTAAPKKSGFRSGAVRWALAGGAVYWYATSNVFADEPKYPSDEPSAEDDDDRPPSLLPEHSLRSTRKAPDAEDNRLTAADNITRIKNHNPPKGEATHESHVSPMHHTGPEELEEEAGQQGAFNPETGEINWDCPCLGGMADGPCGEQFKTAFSCFVFSKEDPKGVDCIDKFKGMQTCFQLHPEIYGSELDDDEDDEGDEDNESPADQSESSGIPNDSTNIPTHNTETPINTTKPTDGPPNRADAPINTTASKVHSPEPSGRPEPTESTKQGSLAPPVGTTRSDTTASTTKDNEVMESKANPKPVTVPERIAHQEPKPVGPDTREGGEVEVSPPSKLEFGESERRGREGGNVGGV